MERARRPSPSHNQEALLWIWVIWHNYWGNSNTTPVIANWYIDDPYISIMNGQARVELGNASTYETCTHREVQLPTAWSSTEITFNANYGSFDPAGTGLTCWIYVVDNAGAVSNGQAITLPPNQNRQCPLPSRNGKKKEVTEPPVGPD